MRRRRQHERLPIAPKHSGGSRLEPGYAAFDSHHGTDRRQRTERLAPEHGRYIRRDREDGGGQWSQTRYDDLSGGLGHGGTLTDFTLAVGQGYALYSDRSGSVPIEGGTASSQQWSLQAGWNLVGLPLGANPASAYGLLDTLLGKTGGSFAEIDALAGGSVDAWRPRQPVRRQPGKRLPRLHAATRPGVRRLHRRRHNAYCTRCTSARVNPITATVSTTAASPVIASELPQRGPSVMGLPYCRNIDRSASHAGMLSTV